jgi:hypothetical protein
MENLNQWNPAVPCCPTQVFRRTNRQHCSRLNARQKIIVSMKQLSFTGDAAAEPATRSGH